VGSPSSDAGSVAARFASSASTASASSTTRIFAGSATSSRSAARSPRVASRGAAPGISGSWPVPSAARARWPCSPRPPS